MCYIVVLLLLCLYEMTLTPVRSEIHTAVVPNANCGADFKNIQLCCLWLEQLAVVCKRTELANDVIKGVSGVTN